jgi:uncharacterized membrane protein YkvA (DUF1232 family)
MGDETQALVPREVYALARRETPALATRQERRFYRKLRDRVCKWAREKRFSPQALDYLLAAPDLFVLLARLALDSRVPPRAKAKLGAGLVYFVSPIDLIPDLVPGWGFMDDVAVAAWTIYTLTKSLNAVDPAVLRDHWEGGDDVLDRIADIVARTEAVLGTSFQFVVSALRELRGSMFRDFQAPPPDHQ